jgi:large subunit ribosomal protein L4
MADTKTSAPKAPLYGADGKQNGEFELPETYDIEPNVPVMHAVVTAQLAAARSGTHSTKTRAEVRGGGVRPWRQKGTGRARHGSIREPQWVGGGIAHGPKPRDYSQRISKKEKALALNGALTVRLREGAVKVVEFPNFDKPETKRAVALLEQWGCRGKVLLVVGSERLSDNVFLSLRNLGHVMAVSSPTAYRVLAADTIVISKSALETAKEESK